MAELKPWGTRFDDSEGIQLLKVLEARRTERFVLTRIEEEARWGPAIRSSETLFSKYFESLLTEEFSRLGFSSNLAFSSTGFPVVSRHLCGPWHVCWSAENKRLLANWPRERSGDIARWNTLRLRCFLASESFKGEPSVDLSLRDSSFVTLRLGQVVNGFDWAYSQINGVEQLRIILAAYAYLYSLVCPTLEDEIIGFLASS
ncbi:MULTISPECIES: hypothetical protein [Pseudomonadota]|uniref:hypothetical protein n=1 Tax=Pseudomonadota TaxID=1224 RepID=UPI0011850433|nr:MULTISPECIES: hypothetical protein [Pseudomonadota]MBN6746296.1 hypothetical protein [Acidithiobacillus sp. MC2.2]MDG0852179.1 hypothetical protein [Roseateles puraquae]